MILKLLRAIGLLPRPAISRDQAVEIAREECTKNGWPWIEPIRVDEGINCYHICTNASVLGSNANIRISAKDGRVVAKALAER